MAEEHGALLLAVEHRFYGDSINPDGLETQNLAELSSQQVLVLLSYHSVCSNSVYCVLSQVYISLLLFGTYMFLNVNIHLQQSCVGIIMFITIMS